MSRRPQASQGDSPGRRVRWPTALRSWREAKTTDEDTTMFAAMFGRRPYGNELSPAEKTTLLKAVHGTPTAEIATTMHRSAHTVKSHLKAAYRKLGVSNRAAAGMKLLSMGLL